MIQEFLKKFFVKVCAWNVITTPPPSLPSPLCMSPSCKLSQVPFPPSHYPSYSLVSQNPVHLYDPHGKKVKPDCCSWNILFGCSVRLKNRFSFSDPDNSIQSIEELSNGDIELKGLLPDNSALPEDEEDEEFELTVHGQSS